MDDDDKYHDAIGVSPDGKLNIVENEDPFLDDDLYDDDDEDED